MSNKLSVNDLDALTANENYDRYHQKKLKIQEKYPKHVYDVRMNSKLDQTEEFYKNEWHLWQQYKKEITDLLLKPNGDYQLFVWDIISGYEKTQQDRVIKGKRDKKIEY